MILNIIRHFGSKNTPVIECCNTTLQKYKVRTDFQPHIDPISKEEMNTFIEMEFPYKPSMKEVKDFVTGVINAQTDYKILTGFVWNNIHVYLSIENQRNFSEAYHMAQSSSSILPITFKLGENEDGEPVYHTFSTSYELSDFYTQAFAYINQCLNEGWQRKDAIDWEPYKALYPEPEDIN